MDKVVESAARAVADTGEGASLAVGGMGAVLEAAFSTAPAAFCPGSELNGCG